MGRDWKTDRAEAAMKEGTDKIMKAAQEKAKKEEPLFKEQIENHTEPLKDANFEETPFEICIGVGMNQFFPEYIRFEVE
jgi:hypothetical protein